MAGHDMSGVLYFIFASCEPLRIAISNNIWKEIDQPLLPCRLCGRNIFRFQKIHFANFMPMGNNLLKFSVDNAICIKSPTFKSITD